MKSSYRIAMSLLAFALTATAMPAFAYDGTVSTTGKTSLSFRVENMASVSGFGAHFCSGDASSDGYGGNQAECHFVTGADNNVSFLCYDGYLDPQNHVNFFRASLGPKSELSVVDIEISARQVTVTGTRLTMNSYTSEKFAYTTTTVMPLRQQSGFWRNSTIYYQTNGVLACNGGACLSPPRTGTGYAISALASR